MTRASSIFADTFLTVIGVLIAAGIIYGIVVSANFVPVLEGRVFPVVRFAPVTAKDVYRDADKVCFTLHLTKLQGAVPIQYVFFADTTEGGYVFSPQLPLSTYLATPDHQRDMRRFETHAVGTSWDRHWCFETPGTVAGWQKLSITGQALHRRHWLFDTVTPIPTFEIPAFKS